jgi:gamma-glutamyl:cysteine ligase YbdK (ATP-grasp superfamily)
MLERNAEEFTFLRLYTESEIYRSHLVKHLGLENEIWLTKLDNFGKLKYMPFVHEFLPILKSFDSYKDRCQKEFSAAQLELTTRPCSNICQLVEDMRDIISFARIEAKKYGFSLTANEYVADKDMTLEVSPIEGRYMEYAKNHSQKVNEMCRVAAWHLHIGMYSFEHACDVYNCLVDEIPKLIAEGDWIDLRRLRAFNEVICPGWLDMPKYYSVDDLCDHAKKQGFIKNPVENYSAVRISPFHGTVELRLPGATDDFELMYSRVRRVCDIINL